MAIEAHLKTLEQKHSELDEELSKALNAPSVDDLIIADLKRKKLQIKDEIEKIKLQIA